MVLISFIRYCLTKCRTPYFRPLAGIMVLISRFRNLSFDLSDTVFFRPLAGIMVLISKYYPRSISHKKKSSVPLRGLWFLSRDGSCEACPTGQQPFRPLAGIMVLISAPFIDGFMKPLKWHFAGRIIYFHHFSSFARK